MRFAFNLYFIERSFERQARREDKWAKNNEDYDLEPHQADSYQIRAETHPVFTSIKVSDIQLRCLSQNKRNDGPVAPALTPNIVEVGFNEKLGTSNHWALQPTGPIA
jgi:hypothetical protein